MQYKKVQKSSWNESYSSSFFTKQSCSKMALYRWIRTESRWNKKLISLSSPDWSASLRPSLERKTRPDALIRPNDSTAFIIIIFWPSVDIFPGEFKNWDIQNWVQIYQSLQSGVGKLSCNKTALKRCTSTETLWNRKVLSLSSPEDEEIFLPKLPKSWHADVFRGPIIIVKIYNQVSLVCIIVLCYSINKLTYLLNQTQSNVVIRQVDTYRVQRTYAFSSFCLI